MMRSIHQSADDYYAINTVSALSFGKGSCAPLHTLLAITSRLLHRIRSPVSDERSEPYGLLVLQQPLDIIAVGPARSDDHQP
jgi:hypothetical protein